MTETRAAYEAATLEAMHTGDWSALAAYARTVADVDGEPEPPARHVDGDDYTWAGPSYPAAPVLAEDNAALREQITQLHCDYSGQIATLELRVRELESERLSLNEAIAVADKLNAVQRVKELESERRTVRALLTAFLHSDDTSAVRALDRWLTTNKVQP